MLATAYDISQIMDQIGRLLVLVVGDIMLDNYQYGNTHRISPEAPVPVVHITHKESRLGGAANVALNCVAMGANVSVAATVGADRAGEIMLDLLAENGISTDLILRDEHKPTTTKTRIIARQHQLLRIDEEDNTPISSAIEHPFLDRVLKYIQMHKPDVIIMQDYNKGLMKENVIQRIIAHANIYGAVISVDPKEENFFDYINATIFKPNLSELSHAIGDKDNKKVLTNIHTIAERLMDKINAENILVTLSEKGVYYHNADDNAILPTVPRSIVDVSGAGDTVISVASLVYAVTKEIRQSAIAANIAGGIVCESVGVVPIDKNIFVGEYAKYIDNNSL